LIETRDLCRYYGNDDPVRALDGVNLRIAAGEFVAVMGASGSGKSTLLNVLGALDRPTAGQVLIDGEDLQRIRDQDAFRARKVGFVFQLHNLLPTMTALENVEIPMIGTLGPRERRKRADDLLEMVGMAARRKHLPGQLSGGQRQRVAVARALANRPPLVLADEPTGNLDTSNSGELLNLLGELNRTQGTTFIVVTHDPAVGGPPRPVNVMVGGKKQRGDVIGSPLEEDLKMWQHSALGQRLIDGDPQLLAELGLSAQAAAAIRSILT
jgi:ABC-type lipoprotein export system ATPase subunit